MYERKRRVIDFGSRVGVRYDGALFCETGVSGTFDLAD